MNYDAPFDAIRRAGCAGRQLPISAIRNILVSAGWEEAMPLEEETIYKGKQVELKKDKYHVVVAKQYILLIDVTYGVIDACDSHNRFIATTGDFRTYRNRKIPVYKFLDMLVHTESNYHMAFDNYGMESMLSAL